MYWEMSTPASSPVTAADDDIVSRMLRGELTEEQAKEFARRDSECIAFTLLAVQQRLAQQQAHGPNTPSAAIPPYQKPAAKEAKTPKRKRGGQKGHPGRSRKTPEPDRKRKHQCEKCPHCSGKLKRTDDTRSRITEDIPEDLKPVVTEEIIHSDWCPKCKKRVEPKIPDVLPRCTLGNRTLVLTALLHFLQGLTLSQIVDTFNFHLRMRLTPGGLVQMWHRLSDILFAWYEEIHQQILESGRLHADETGWRVSGKTHWLWCFGNDTSVFYMIDRSRGSPAIQKFFTQAFDGVLITDFWSPYDSVCCAEKQKCWPHLLRDMAKVDEQTEDTNWKSFSRRLVGVYRDAKKLHGQRDAMQESAYDHSVGLLESRVSKLASESWEHADAKRLAKRLVKHGGELLTFLWHESVPSDNNHGERLIRPAVMIRKNSYCNHSDRGALTQSVLMSVLRTLRLRGHNPIDQLLEALASYSETGKLPALPFRAAE